MALSYNKKQLVIMLSLTVAVAGVVGPLHLFAPRLLATSMRAEPHPAHQFMYSDGFIGSVVCAFASCAALALLSDDPGAYSPILLLQLVYKVVWLAALVANGAEFDVRTTVYTVVWVAFILGDLAVFFPRPAAPSKVGGSKAT